LDEVPAGLRRAVVESVDDFVGRYPRHRYLVTCRPYAYVGQPWRLSGFREVTLAPFSEEQVAHFVTVWYDELARRGRFTRAQASARAARLHTAATRADLRGLAERPLLLTVMALLHTFRGQLPEDRVELYRWTVDLLLRRWEGRVGDEEGILEALALPGLKMSDLEAGLYEVAFRAHQGQGEAEGTVDVAERDLRAWLAPYLGGSWDQAGRFVDYIRERAGLLVRHKPAAYTFPHRTFQEYLAACHLTGHADFPGEAARLAREDLDRWRVVYVLAAGHAARTHRLGSALSAVNALCPEPYVPGGGAGDDAWRAAVLAGQALLEIGLVGVQREPVGQAVLERVQGWLAALLRAGALDPRERAGAGAVLAQLGDPRFREDAWYLPDEPLLGFVEIPAGPFLMGTREGDIPALMERFGGDREWYEWEPPRHEVALPPCYIARHPVTVAQFSAFAEAGGYQERRYWAEAEAAQVWQDGKVRCIYAWINEEGNVETSEELADAPASVSESFNLANHPVVGVTWYEALAYCRWLTEKLREWNGTPEPLVGLLRQDGWAITLPSEAEWEKAARGGVQIPRQVENPEPGRAFPWGNEPDPNRGNYDETGVDATSAVGCFPGGASPYGVEDLSGNVWEWTRSLWGEKLEEPDFGYPYDPGDGREDLEAGRGVLRVLRGGAFSYVAGSVRCASRLGLDPYSRFRSRGFRLCVVSQQD
jgi:formylglycine-generating enzyme required for sulfatase activity